MNSAAFNYTLIAIMAVNVLALPFLAVRPWRQVQGWTHTGSASAVLLGLWLHSCGLTYALWGPVALIIGILVMGFMVIPMAFVACLCAGLWLGAVDVAMLLTFTCVFFKIGFWAGAAHEKQQPSSENVLDSRKGVRI